MPGSSFRHFEGCQNGTTSEKIAACRAAAAAASASLVLIDGGCPLVNLAAAGYRVGKDGQAEYTKGRI